MTLSKMIENNCNKLIFDCSDEELFEGLIKTVVQLKGDKKNKITKKKLYYISAEFLVGKLLESNLTALGIYDEVRKILEDNGKSLSQITEVEVEPELGNGGLGRLAACFMDSVAHLGLCGDGVGLLYHYGLFRQVFSRNKQEEAAQPWIDKAKILNKTDLSYMVQFKDTAVQSRLYTIDVLGKGRNNRLNLFDIDGLSGDEMRDNICYDKKDIKNSLTQFLYPDDSDEAGRRLRLCQEYFMVSNAAQLIIEESVGRGSTLLDLDEYAVIQINDTHPSLIIPELIRLLTERGIGEEEAMSVISRCCAYTNHTILAEALEKWPRKMMEDVIPQIMEIIERMDGYVRRAFDDESLYIIDSDDNVHMARMDIHFGFSVNGVAELHTSILKNSELSNFHKVYPSKFNNKTNGITMRRWLICANPDLYDYIVSLIGCDFTDDYTKLKDLLKFVDDKRVLNRLLEIKEGNKKKLCRYIKEKQGDIIDSDSIFDVQIKRLHEYKRQQMNVLYIINKSFEILEGKTPKRPLTFIFGAKAAPAYTVAKDIIHLILCMREYINSTPILSKHMRIFTAENYNVTWAEKIIPAGDVSEQISLASKEASGTGNMKLMLNGAITLGTRDGANVEIENLVGKDNIYIFGDDSRTVLERYKSNSYKSRDFYENDDTIRRAVDFITSDELAKYGDRSFLERLQRELTNKDYFMTFPDFDDYCKTKDRVFDDYEDRESRGRKMLINIANSGFFSADRTINEYNRDIWKLEER